MRVALAVATGLYGIVQVGVLVAVSVAQTAATTEVGLAVAGAGKGVLGVGVLVGRALPVHGAVVRRHLGAVAYALIFEPIGGQTIIVAAATGTGKTALRL